VVEQNNLPPGQAKKIYGDKSAKYYAPGHNKYKNIDTKLKKPHNEAFSISVRFY
jgi:hypothetical protein